VTKRQPAAETGRIAAEPAAILALARGLSKADAAAGAGVGERTVYRWLDDDAFRAAISRERGRLLERAIGRLADHAADAANVLGKLANDEETPPAVRVSAARALLEHAVKLRDSLEIEERLAAVEARLEKRAA
jgi:methylaspartate ammonia-lyase